MLTCHDGCTQLLISWGAPSAGGRYHTAALTIQGAWQRHRAKVTHCSSKQAPQLSRFSSSAQRREEVRRSWAAAVIGRSVRWWLRRREAQRLQQLHETARHRAATTIQFHWRRFTTEQRRYEASCTRLKAKLEQ